MTRPQELGELLAWGRQQLSAAGIESARTDTELLAGHLLGITRGELAAGLISGRDFALDSDSFSELIAERARRVPLQHLTGTAPFRGLELAVGPGVFIPRPETESVAQVAIDEIELAAQRRTEENEPVIAVDLCTGSGAIALALATESRADEVHAVEFSELAFAWAQQNAQRSGAGHLQHLHLHLADATAPTTLADLDGRVDVVVSNPPYIPPDQVPVDIEVREHDPEIALYGGGADGLKVPRAVLNRARSLLRPGGVIVMEHAEVQAGALRAAAAEQGWSRIETRADLAGRPRMLYAAYDPTAAKMGE